MSTSLRIEFAYWGMGILLLGKKLCEKGSAKLKRIDNF
jgi:hypothetical protein